MTDKAEEIIKQAYMQGFKDCMQKLKNCQNCKNWSWKYDKCVKKLRGDCFKGSKWEMIE